MKNLNHSNQLILINPEEFQELVRDLKSLKDSLIESVGNTSIPPLLRNSDVKKILKISDSTLAGLRQNGTIPFSKIGGTIYYLKKDLEEMIEENYSNEWNQNSNKLEKNY